MNQESKPKTVAIYCRKSTEEGLDREFNSLDAQRQSCEHFAASQSHEGWVISPIRYDDGGYSGSNTERPGIQRLLEDIDSGQVQVVAVYKIDRLSRSLNDFVTLLKRLEDRQVAFVSVTQHFNTATPMGRLMLNILICFAQFERENTIERVRDKVAASKRLGRWCGGTPILGYDVVPNGRKLAINPDEAERVRAIFALYQEHRTLTATLEALERRGWSNKAWTAQTGRSCGGKPFCKSTLAHLLGNITYTGRVLYRGTVYPAEHPAIISIEVFDAVQNQLSSQNRSGGAETKTKHIALLKGLLVCDSCKCAMTYWWGKRGSKVHTYYVCYRSRERGAATCPMPNIPAGTIEKLVIEEIAALCRDRAFADQIIATIDPEHSRAARQALRKFEPVWSALAAKERAEVLRALIERISLNGHTGKIAFTFRDSGIAGLVQQTEVA
jgi:site-specific DNA recombinase